MPATTSFSRVHFFTPAFIAAAIAACGSAVEQPGTSSTSTTSSNTGGASLSSSGGVGGQPASSSSSSSSASSSSSSSSSSSASSSTSSSASSTGGAPDLLAELKAGPWLFGWSGGLDHYSWVRFDFVNATQGSVRVLDAKCPSCTSYWPCEGQGLFSADPEALSLVLQLPAGCNNTGHTLVFSGFDAPGTFPMGATRHASLTDDGSPIDGFRFPPAYCDAAFQSCGDPFL